MRKALLQFGHHHTIDWFSSKGVELYTLPDNRMFPVSDRLQTIIDCLRKAATGAGGCLDDGLGSGISDYFYMNKYGIKNTASCFLQ
jgi:predicted flavoprotein YhiN